MKYENTFHGKSNNIKLVLYAQSRPMMLFFELAHDARLRSAVKTDARGTPYTTH